MISMYRVVRDMLDNALLYILMTIDVRSDRYQDPVSSPFGSFSVNLNWIMVVVG